MLRREEHVKMLISLLHSKRLVWVHPGSGSLKFIISRRAGGYLQSFSGLLCWKISLINPGGNSDGWHEWKPSLIFTDSKSSFRCNRLRWCWRYPSVPALLSLACGGCSVFFFSPYKHGCFIWTLMDIAAKGNRGVKQRGIKENWNTEQDETTYLTDGNIKANNPFHLWELPLSKGS